MSRKPGLYSTISSSALKHSSLVWGVSIKYLFMVNLLSSRRDTFSLTEAVARRLKTSLLIISSLAYVLSRASCRLQHLLAGWSGASKDYSAVANPLPSYYRGPKEDGGRWPGWATANPIGA